MNGISGVREWEPRPQSETVAPEIAGQPWRRAGWWKMLLGKLALRFSHYHTPRERLFLKHVSIHGVDLIVPSNEDVGRLISYLGSYEPDETDFLIPSIRPEDVCVDVGANIGYYTMLMARAASAGTVHAFEPDPLCNALLHLNISINEFANVRLNPILLGAASGSMQFLRASDSGFSSLRDTGRRPIARTYRVKMDTLDEYLDMLGKGGVDILKIDVEGAEGLVLEGARRLLDDPHRRPRLILLELFEPNQRPFGSKVSEVVSRLGSSGYSPFVVCSGMRMPYTAAHENIFSNVFFEASMPAERTMT